MSSWMQQHQSKPAGNEMLAGTLIWQACSHMTASLFCNFSSGGFDVREYQELYYHSVDVLEIMDTLDR
jgi:hypothetical protein